MSNRQFDPEKLEEAKKCLVNSAGSPYGQTVSFDPDVFHEVLALVNAALQGEEIKLENAPLRGGEIKIVYDH